jgi:hypothetical protein
VSTVPSKTPAICIENDGFPRSSYIPRCTSVSRALVPAKVFVATSAFSRLHTTCLFAIRVSTEVI